MAEDAFERPPRKIGRRPTLKVEVRHRAHPEHDQHRERDQRDHDGHVERHLHAPHIERHENAVRQQPPKRLPFARRAENRPQIAADAHHDHRGRENVLHVFGESRDVAGGRPHRSARERVRAARVRQGGRHLGNGEAQADVHCRHDEHGQDHAAKPARCQAEIPAEKIPGDDGAHSHGPQVQDAGVPAKPAPAQVRGIGGRIGGFHVAVLWPDRIALTWNLA